MPFQPGFSIATVKEIFTEEIVASGGTVSDTYEDDSRLFIRSTLPWIGDVRPHDTIQGGVALKAVEHEVWVHPYLFRQVCRNGAIMAQAIQTEHLDGLNYFSDEDACEKVRAAVQGCCVQDAFQVAAEQMRTAQEREADLFLNLLPMLSRFRPENPEQLATQIRARFVGERDTSRFGLMNAVTSLARDTRDPELRWRLEELGGGIPVARTPKLSPDRTAAELLTVR